MSNFILEIKDLTVSYENNIVFQDLNFEIKRGGFYCLVGENGSGKSTLMKSIVGLTPVKSGNISFNHHEISTKGIHEIIKFGVGYLGQTNNVFSRLKVKDHLELAIKNNKLIVGIEETIPEILKLKNEYAGTLSGGQQRLLGLIITIMQGRELLLLDEPFAGISKDIKNKIQNILLDVSKNTKTTILMIEQSEDIISHFQGEVININELKKLKK